MNFYHLDEIPEYLKQYFEPAPQIGLEETPEAYINRLVAVFREVKRVLKDESTLWVNIGDTYSAHKDCKAFQTLCVLAGKVKKQTKLKKE